MDVTIYLGSGEHFFFACFGRDVNADISVINAAGSDDKVTDYCSRIESLKAVYATSDNVRLTVKPMDCAQNNRVGASEIQLWASYCVDFSKPTATKPKIIVNSAFVNFNVTNEATFENLQFEGNDNLAFYQESTNNGKPIEEFPV